ncbi:ATP-binding cassette domain-containing protein [Bradyrhizobium sp. U87765 SZCCT0131]|uniref:peptidase domain-containing ABC transporter n=1 Tax=unclassified Bradyrhizobium TaxID=2631580 RepID=UPI001BA7BE72|nr:ATP-binding cassette domain-containing protein [Bradyrhizobium sp. U87765 SZCCT0131]MBR1260594.1 ATP-binding cassette domain-containing protein [Bradyrhizobium sp. U87765 SZCCT0134]MBR1303958.1 ATP-binding cassette domain-containing protein [Bradyrhizobium sp. U87765 SZCCT0110]MBR1319564.1 ATP-binding cassette domain-containing protein [Bradyrhizobium sp. U87765 SZCCT0109]MBR1347889.1 ATP-binding cassette domain-containing protein [Bradyrhizobium sp. U87765 SZCCT0048]
MAAVLAMTCVIYAAALVFPVSTQKAVDAIVTGHAEWALAGLGLLAGASVVVEAALSSWRQKLMTGLVVFLDQRLSRRTFAHLMRARIDGGDFRSGDILNHFQQATKIRDFVLYRVPHVVFDTGGAIVALVLMIAYDPLIGLVFVAIVPGLLMLMRSQLGPLHRAADEFYGSIGTRQNVLSESVNGIATIKAQALEGGRMRRWDVMTRAMLAKLALLMDLNRGFQLRSQVVSRGLTLLVVGLGCWRMFQGHLTVGELLALQLLAGRITGPLLSAGDLYRSYQEAAVALERIRSFVSEPRERAMIDPPRRAFGNGGIVLSGVSLTYPDASRPALDDINVALPARGVVALVGRNGSGKSTLVRILLGLLGGYDGRVEVFGHDLRHYDPRWLRGRFGVVDQETMLFSGTIREAIAASGRRHDDAGLHEALHFAGAAGFVEALPKGMDSELNEGGRSLSGGQRQRLAIARAVVRDPALALLDEPTAFLDAEAAVALEQRLAAWGRERLLILVSHHLAATRGADRILVLDQGRLVGDGRHEQLLARTPEYASLWADYARSVEAVSV